MTILNKIKLSILAIFAYFGIYFLAKRNKNKQLDKLDSDIQKNNNDIAIAETKAEAIETQKQQSAEIVVTLEEKVEALEAAAETVDIPVITDVVAAKENIIKKTKRRRKSTSKNKTSNQ